MSAESVEPLIKEQNEFLDGIKSRLQEMIKDIDVFQDGKPVEPVYSEDKGWKALSMDMEQADWWLYIHKVFCSATEPMKAIEAIQKEFTLTRITQ